MDEHANMHFAVEKVIKSGNTSITYYLESYRTIILNLSVCVCVLFVSLC